MATLTDAQKIEKYRAAANDKTIPQDARNQLLDKANEIEYKAYEAQKKKLAKGGMVEKAPMKKAPMKAMAKGGDMKKSISEYGGKEMYASKGAMAKHEKGEGKAMEKKEKMMSKGKPSGVAIIITPAKKLAKGGMAKKKC
jgi:uncharacterized protein YoaH (UPF0181 family)